MNESRTKRIRWWVPLVIVLLGAGAILGIHVREVVFREHITVAITLLTSLLVMIWAVVGTGLSMRWRMAGLGLVLALVLACGFVVKNYTRVEGSLSGGGLPRLVWKWTPPPDRQLPGIAPIQTQIVRPMGESEGFSFPQFLGSGRTNAVPGTGLASDWPTRAPKELWRQPIGSGWAGFAVASHRAVTQEQRGEHELIVCYNLVDGKALWAHTNEVRFFEELGGPGPRATPTLAGERVYAMGATGILDCLDLATGKLIWTRATLKDPAMDNLTWAKSDSPLVLEEKVVVTGGSSGPLLLAFKRDTGELLWEGGAGSAAYASPVLATLAGRSQLLIVNAQNVTGHDPANGKTLWKYDWPGSMPKVSQPIAVGANRVFISAGYGLGAVLLELTPTETGTFTASEIWRNRFMKTKFTNVAIREGFVYGLDDGILACIELATGNRRWKDGRYGHGQLLLVNNVLLVQSESGSVVLVEATPSAHREIGRWPALNSKTWNNPALAGPYLLLRNDREALCLKLQEPEGADSLAQIERGSN